MKYLDTSWFIEAFDVPQDQAQAAARGLLGYYLAWALLNELGAEIHTAENAAGIEGLKGRTMTPLQYLGEQDKLTDEDFNEEGNAFAARYLEALYFEDYVKGLIDHSDDGDYISVEDSWQNYDRLAARLDNRLKRWRAGAPLKRSWRRLWM